MSTIRNHVQLLGFVGQDPEIRSTVTGKKVAKFSIATTDSYRDASGQWHNETTWHNISCWEALAEHAERQVRKGSHLLLTGKIRYRKYTDSNNTERFITEITPNTLTLLDAGSARAGASASSRDAIPACNSEMADDDLPF